MKKGVLALLALTLSLCVVCAQAVTLDGTIKAVREQLICAPYSGTVQGCEARQGDTPTAGDVLLGLSTTKIVADFDGVITGQFAKDGDSVSSVLTRYGALCCIERDVRFGADCTISGAGSDIENKIVHVGETVYVRSTDENRRTGTAIVTGVSNTSYTLELTEDTELRRDESVRVYRKANYESASCIGSGTIFRIDPVVIKGEGSVLRVAVTDGQNVARGDLLYELVPDALTGLVGGDGFVRMPQDGVLTQVCVADGDRVSQDQTLARYARAEDIALVCMVDEEDLPEIEVGMRMDVNLDAYPNKVLRGEITRISAVSSGAQFEVTIALEKSSLVRIGMSASAEES